MTKEEMVIGGMYNWKNQPEKLIYIGQQRYGQDRRSWYQFAKVERPELVGSEVLETELHMIEETAK